ncbi:hypothetical protein AVEN_252015-1 [Araneus ventricosus]|uniref:Uncharacterized protein n=1 Tax=Araneus ventricosus TaxID=182803 RepID=A0A4Y2QJF3_ARAVE|nr:hypothetical protein AVEN_252015-1 [Araneus ventricosus]
MLVSLWDVMAQREFWLNCVKLLFKRHAAIENLIDPSVFRRFIQGFLTVRRSAKFSCGTSTDMIIEQSLMKSMQTDGVFDGYSDYTKNIKFAEQHRRTAKISSSSDVLFDRFMTGPTNQQQFLANTHNKYRFISMLSEKLKAADIFVKQANNDADVLIIETALEKFNTNTTIVVVCSNCQGKSHSNVESNTTDEDAYDINEDISDPSFFLEQSIEIQQQGEEEESEE